MQAHNLELSNIVLKEQHYLPEPTLSNFHFQHEPITHKVQRGNVSKQKMQMKHKELKERKQILQKSQRMKRQLLLQKIAAKNERFQLRRKAEKQNMRTAQTNDYQNTKNKFQIQVVTSPQKQRFEVNNIQKIYVNNQKMQFSSTKGFNTYKEKPDMMRKTINQAGDGQKFKQIKFRAVKLPQLNSGFSKGNQQFLREQPIKTEQYDLNPKSKEPKTIVEQPINPLLKVHDTRYFGIQQNEEDYQKIGKNLLKQIRKKYWCYESLENQQVYDNFENFLFDELA